MKSILALTGVALAVVRAGFAFAGEPSVQVTCVRPSHLYQVAEAAEFEVTSSVTGLPVRIGFKRGYLPPKETVVTTTPVRVSFRLGEPGFVVCEAQAKLDGGKFGAPVRAGAGFEPHLIRTALPPVKDFDAFWDAAFAEQAAIAPDFKVEATYSNGVQLVSCQTVQGTRMYGFLHVPKGDGPFPFHVQVGGGDSVQCADWAVDAANLKDYAKTGFLFIHLPPWAPVAKTAKDASECHKRWREENKTSSLFRWKGDQGPKDRWFYRCILGSCRLTEYAATRPGVDPKRVYYWGASTGGGYGVFLAAFSPYVRAAICEVPNYGNAGGPSVGRPSGEDDRGEHWQTSLYYDAAHCAPRITCPVFMSCGYVDNSCVPETIYCIYNAMRCRKTMFDKIVNGHGDCPPGYGKLRADWLAKTLGEADKAEDPLKGRTWLLHRPEGPAKGAVVMLYGYGGKAAGYCPKMVDAAKRHGFAVCVPEAIPDGNGKRSWNVGYPSQAKMTVDDTAFLDALAAKLRVELGVRHVFLTGMSNGGEMCYQMAYRSPRTFDAIASVSGLTLTALSEQGAPQGNVPFMELHGDADKTSLWEGDLKNANKYWGAYLAVPEAVARVVAANGGAKDKFAERRVGPSVTCRTWPGMFETRLYHVEKGGHSWFFEAFDSGDEICRFFESVLGW